MESLFGKDDAARLAIVEQFGTAKILRELLDIFESDPRRIDGVSGGFVVPGAAVEKILGIRMEGEVPIEIPAFLGAFGEVIDEGTSGEGLLLVAAGVADVPVMFE